MDDAVNSSHAYWQSQSASRSVDASVSGLSSGSAPGFTLGMSSFNEQERGRFGQRLRLSMALIEGKASAIPTPGKALPDDAPSIAQRLKSLSQDITSSLADLLELLTRFDILKGWERGGAKSCALWMNLELGIGLQLAREYLRVGRDLRNLPVVTALFRAGKLTWSKVRLLTRVADDDNESLLCHAALDASVSQVERLCHEYRWQDDENERASEKERALQQWEARSLRWDECVNGNVRISLSLPSHLAQAFLNSVEYSLAQLEPSPAQTSMTQRRADAAVLMAENNLQNAGRDIATADRYQVIVSVDAAELSHGVEPASGSKTTSATPAKRATLLGASTVTSPLAKDTARRLACDCSASTIITDKGVTDKGVTDKGELMDIGQKTRTWPTPMARAIRARDKCCVWPGCTQKQHLQIHHIKHWADGGATSMKNGVCVCTAHHVLLHEGGYRIEKVADNEQRLHEQFIQQTVDAGDTAWEVEKRLRNSSESFDAVRQVSPERFRFRVVDSDGRDVVGTNRDTRVLSTPVDNTETTYQASQSKVDSFVAEPAARYAALNSRPTVIFFREQGVAIV